jgi:hypothetical protein
MDIGKERIVYHRATIDDVPVLVEYRVQFLNELYNHPELVDGYSSKLP